MSITAVQKRLTEKNITEAYIYAADAHKGQKRKFTQLEYASHCAHVAQICALWHQEDDVLKAALLHDVIEDTDKTYDDIQEKFGQGVADMVWDCTDPPNVRGDTRRRMKIEKIRALPVGSPSAFVQLADLVSNVSDLMYAFEKLELGMTVFDDFGAGIGIVRYYEKKFEELSRKIVIDDIGIMAYGHASAILGGIYATLHKAGKIEELEKLPDPF